jgi:hypothetical protein
MKIRAWLMLLVLLIISADEPVKLIKLTLINKAEIPVAVQLIGQSDNDYYYYLQVPEGDREDPQERTFTIASDYYNMQVYYVETYDPVYGFDCQPTMRNELRAVRNIRVVFLPCSLTGMRFGDPDKTDLNGDGYPDFQLPNFGEPSMRKYLPYPVIHPFCLFTDDLLLPPSNCRGYGIFRFIY